MGYSLAEKARDLGAEVILISGPVSIAEISGVKTVKVETAVNMEKEVLRFGKSAEYIFMTAAVADYIPAEPANLKMKRKAEKMNLSLNPAPDILKSIKGKIKAVTTAFSLETHDGESEAKRKMLEKGVNFIVLNYANEIGAGFDSSTNRVTIFSKTGDKIELKKDRKDRIAQKIIDFVIQISNQSELTE